MATYRTVTATASITNTAVSAAASVCDMAFAANAVSQRVVMGSEEYSGPYEVTPNERTQILDTMGKRMEAPVVVNPIPSNYGRITWNGSVLTVS